jgi:hypothetical protein
VHAAALDVPANAIYGLHRQVHQLASCLPAPGGYGGFGPYVGAGPSAPHPVFGMPGYSALSSAPVHRSHHCPHGGGVPGCPHHPHPGSPVAVTDPGLLRAAVRLPAAAPVQPLPRDAATSPHGRPR